MTTMTQPTLRRAGPDDATAVRDLVRAAYARWVPVLGREPMPMQADYDHAVRAHEIDLMMEDAGLVALIEMIPQPDLLFIANIAVSPGHQGFGLGRKLINHAEQRARLSNLTKLTLLTAAAFESNIRLYKSCGFVIKGTEPFMGGTTVHMAKTIAPAA